jgi:hypothetical protein
MFWSRAHRNISPPLAESKDADSPGETGDNPRLNRSEVDPEAPPQEIIALELKFLCRECATKLIIAVRWQGHRLKCPHCGARVVVPDCSEILRGKTQVGDAGAGLAPIAPRLTSAEVEFLSQRAG